MVVIRLALLLVALVGCSSRNASSAPTPSTPPAPEADVSDRTFSDGPALTPASELLSWLQDSAGDKLLRLPVVVTCSPLGVTAAHIGVSAGPAPTDAVHLKLDQGPLSVALHDQLPRDCMDAPCVVWLEGTWGVHLSGGPADPGLGGPGLPGPGLPGPAVPGGAPSPTRHAFTVRRYAGPVQGPVQTIGVGK